MWWHSNVILVPNPFLSHSGLNATWQVRFVSSEMLDFTLLMLQLLMQTSGNAPMLA